MVFAEVLIPYGHHCVEQSWLVGLTIVFDALMALTLIYFGDKRRDIPFSWIFLLFSVFIIDFGTTLSAQIWSLWHLNYEVSSLLKAVAVVSFALCTLVALVSLVLKALAIKSAAKLEALKNEIKQCQRAQAALLQEKTHLALAQKVAQVGSWEFDFATEQITWSEETFRIYGLASGRPVPTLSELQQTLHSDDITAWETALKRLCRGKPGEVEYRIVRPDGSIRHLLSQGEPIFDSDGQLQKLIGTVLDISDRKHVEERLQLLERAIASSSNGIVITDATQPDNPVIYVNPGFERITGYSVSEIIGKNCRFLHSNETAQPGLDELRRALKEERSCRVVLRNYRKDGTLFWNEFSVSPVRDALGNLTHYIGVQTDITEFKQAEEALRQSEVRFQKLTENVPGVIYQYRQYPDGTDAFTYISPGIRDLFELEAEAVLESTELMWTSVHPDDLSTFIASVHHSAQTGRPWCWEWRAIMPSGTLKWLRGVARLERQSDGSLAWDGILLDISDRKEAEEALFRQEQQYRTLAENCPDIITRFNRELRYVYANPAFEQVTGIPYQDFLGKTNQEVGMPPENLARWNTNIQACFDTAQAGTDEFDFPTLIGQRSYQARLVPEYGKDGEVEFVLVVTRDITELKQTDAALQESEKRFRAIFEQAAVGIVQISLSGQFLQANQRFCDLVGCLESELLMRTCTEITHPDDRELTMEYERQMLSGYRQTYSTEKRYIHKQGQVQWVNLTVSLVRDSQGVPEYFIKVIEDISERKQAEAALRDSEQKFHAVFDSVLEGILIADDNGCIVETNPAACALLGVPKEQTAEHPVLMFTEKEQALKTHNDWQRFLARGQMQGEFTLRLCDGTTKEVEYSAVANFLPGRHLSVFHDITERKQAEAALRAVSQQEREKATLLEQALSELQHTQAQLVHNEKMVSLGQLVAGVAHEINNPTSFIYGNIQPATDYAQELLHLIELYQAYYPKPVAEIAEYIERIDLDFIGEDFPKLLASMKEGAQRISQIVLSLRNFSRLDEKEKKQVDIHEGIDNTLLILGHRLKQQSYRCEIQVVKEYGELPIVECYPGQLNQVFMNLLSNAVDALEMGHGRVGPGESERAGEFFTSNPGLSTNSHPLPTIRIRTEVVEPDWVVIRFADNGPGITTEFQPKIFDPFFTTKPPGKGTGLGLSISYRIVVNKHGGKLTCHSVPGLGAEFAIALPIAQSQTSRAFVNSSNLKIRQKAEGRGQKG